MSLSRVACFVGGAVFGTVGLKVLSTKEAKNACVKVTATGLRVKDSVMDTVTLVQENAADVLAEAKELNEKRAAEEEKSEEEAVIEDALEVEA